MSLRKVMRLASSSWLRPAGVLGPSRPAGSPRTEPLALGVVRLRLGVAPLPAWRHHSSSTPHWNTADSGEASASHSNGCGMTGLTPGRTYKAVTIDLFGTLLGEAIGEAKVYAMMMQRHGYPANVDDIDARYRVAYKRHKTNDTLRYVGDGKEFWKVVVMEAVDCTDERVFEDIYSFYELPAAWKVSKGAFPAIQKLHKHGVGTAVISDFDTRLRELVQSFGLDRAFDQIICSAEVGVEKPDPLIFEAACTQLGVKPHEVLHIGDSERRDFDGARDYGCDALLWGRDIQSFADLTELVLRRNKSDAANNP